MTKSEQERAALKKAQLARLAAKGTPEYPALYAAQPQQVRKAAEYKAQRDAARAAKAAASSQLLSDAEGAIATFDGNMTVGGND
jgi:hypothetical protein